MSDILLWMHPLMQVCAAVLGVWAMWQGLKRVAMLLGKKTLFPWKQHVKLGTLALVLWILGALGFYVTLDLFGSTTLPDCTPNWRGRSSGWPSLADHRTS